MVSCDPGPHTYLVLEFEKHNSADKVALILFSERVWDMRLTRVCLALPCVVLLAHMDRGLLGFVHLRDMSSQVEISIGYG